MKGKLVGKMIAREIYVDRRLAFAAKPQLVVLNNQQDQDVKISCDTPSYNAN